MPSQNKNSQGAVARKEMSGFLYAVLVFTLLLICCGESVGFSVFNKYVFSGPLKAPIFVTATHQIFCFLGAFMLWQVSPPSFYTRTPITSGATVTKIMLIPLAFVMNIGMNNLSLQFTTLALNQLIRSFSPVAIGVTAYLIEGRTQSLPKLLTLSALVGGVVMGVATSPDFDFLGFLICGGSVLGQALGIVMTALMMGDASVRLHVFDVLLYATLPSIVVLLPWSYGMGEFAVIGQSIEREGFGVIAGLIIAGGTFAFTYNLFTTIFIKMTSSVYYGVTGGLRCALAILTSFFIFPQKASPLSIAGIIIAMIAFSGNSYFTMKEQLAEKAKLSVVDVERATEKNDFWMGRKMTSKKRLLETKM